MEENVIFLPGDVVTLRQAIPYKPIMIVVKKETKILRPHKSPVDKLTEGKENYFKGMRCRWFTSTGELQEAVFNTKDLIKMGKSPK